MGGGETPWRTAMGGDCWHRGMPAHWGTSGHKMAYQTGIAFSLAFFIYLHDMSCHDDRSSHEDMS